MVKSLSPASAPPAQRGGENHRKSPDRQKENALLGSPSQFPERLSFNLRGDEQEAQIVTKVKKKAINTSQNMGMYERSMMRLKVREQKLRYIKKDMMKDCTFTPSLNIQKNVAAAATATATIPIWERAHNNTKKSTPKTSIVQQPRSRTSTPRRSPISVDTHSTGSGRLAKLYKDGLKKVQSRTGRTDKEEEDARRHRYEELNMKECTFKPRTHWTAGAIKSGASPDKKMASPANQGISQNMKTPPYQIRPVSLFQLNDDARIYLRTPKSSDSDTSSVCSPPLRIVDTAAEMTSTPMGSTTSLMVVSPLRDPSVVTPLPRGKVVRSMIRSGDSVGSETEYGSI